ncbi:MAG: hypothetical protein ACRDTM_04560 [Micromonosporaceae bacterium]
MGLDLYVGPLTRYYLGDWQTITQQLGAQLGYEVSVVRPEPEPEDRVTDPGVVLGAVRDWQEGIGEALGSPLDWSEGPALPYWTDKPDWDGYGAVALLAAYDEHPDLRHEADDPRAFADAPAHQEASAQPERYYSLLGGVEWWLPLSVDPVVIEASPPAGEPLRMASVDRLLSELRLLGERTGILAGHDLEEVRRAGPADDGAPVEELARFGLAVMLALAEAAAEHRQPLLMDY